MNLIKIIHLTIIFFVCSIAVLPFKYIKKGVYLVPFFMVLSNIGCNGCKFTQMEDPNCKGFMHENVYSKIYKDITIRQSDRITSLFFICILSIIIYRLNKKIELLSPLNPPTVFPTTSPQVR